MKIKEVRKMVKFENLNLGDVFLTSWGNYFMRIIDVYSAEDCCTFNAVNLESGAVAVMRPEEYVTLLDATLTFG